MMRLLDTHTGKFVEKDPRKDHLLYAILSHVWDHDGEQTYQELKRIQDEYAGECIFPEERGQEEDAAEWILPGMRASHGPPRVLSAIWKDLKLSSKVRDVCKVAREAGYRYIWIDSCCIDKTSSSELSEAINSMYTWYQSANVCYAYLADVPPSRSDEDPQTDGPAFRASRWFTRGWTLQELLASPCLTFLSQDWSSLGTKAELCELVNAITGISVDALLGGLKNPHHSFSVAQRLSWAANRETTRVEDRAYSLLGIFDINMPTLYGEGKRAFQRLQEEIIRRIPDQSIFAWGGVHLGPQIIVLDNFSFGPGLQLEGSSQSNIEVKHSDSFEKLLAASPDAFANSHSIETVPLRQLHHHYPGLPALDYTFTPLGIRTSIPLIPLLPLLPMSNVTVVPHASDGEPEPSEWFLAVLGCEHADRPGHLLGQVCCVHWSPSGVTFLHRGEINISLTDDEHGSSRNRSGSSFVTLSAEVLARSYALSWVAEVYLSQTDKATIFGYNISMFLRPHKMINLLLKWKVDTPRSGSNRHSSTALDEPATTLDLRWPDREHPTTHWLTIFRPTAQGLVAAVQDTITIEYTYIFDADHFMRRGLTTIYAHVHGMLRGHAISPVTVLWTDQEPWGNPVGMGRRTIALDNGAGITAEVELDLEYLALNHYVIDAHTEWYNETLHLKEDSDSDSEEGYFTAEEDHIT